jgi:exopolyphosphatase/guanosine-5'-triphosphate,3'-diphosphate pyrophosphatase
MQRRDRIALIEIGTNSTKLLVADVRSGDFRVRCVSRITTRIGRGLEESGHIHPRAVGANAAAVQTLKKTILAHRCDRVFAFSTFALRRAKNSAAVARRLERTIGEPLRILTGRDEARFAYLSATRNLRLAKPMTVLVDIGGGSTELVAARRGRLFCARSLALGALHLTERFLHADPVQPDEFAALDSYVNRITRAALRETGIDRIEPRDIDLVASGGTIGAMSYAIAGSRPRARRTGRDLPARITLGQAAVFLDRCLSVPLSDRRRIPGLDADRADIVCAGLVVAVTMMRTLGKRVLQPNAGGVREGALLHLIQNGFRW